MGADLQIGAFPFLDARQQDESQFQMQSRYNLNFARIACAKQGASWNKHCQKQFRYSLARQLL
jgi:hypothetical protein